MRPCIQQLKLGLDWVMEQDNDLNHNHNWLKKKRIKLLQNQSPGLNLTEVLRGNLKRAIHEFMFANRSKLNQFCKKKKKKVGQAKIPPQ